MPSVPTAAITYSNSRLLSTNGQAKPYRSESGRPCNEGFPQGYPSMKSTFRPELLTQARKSELADLDLPISAVRPTPRLG